MQKRCLLPIPVTAEKVTPLLPWLAGAGFALSHIIISSNCSLPKEGRCASCGGCVVALGALVSWAIWKKCDRPMDEAGSGEPDRR